jgi:hypothetical protein
MPSQYYGLYSINVYLAIIKNNSLLKEVCMKKWFKEYCVLSKTFCPSIITYKYEDEFLDIIGKEVFKSLPPFTVTSNNGFYSPPPTPHLEQSGLKLVCNVNIVFGNLKSENSQNYALKPQQNSFINSASDNSLAVQLHTVESTPSPHHCDKKRAYVKWFNSFDK